MKKLSVIGAVILVSIGVALTYHLFENAVHSSITYVWGTWLDTGTTRWLVIPACIVVGLVFFGLQHYLDQKSEAHESEGLGDMPAPTVINFFKVLLIGFFSLLAGASLGPEAILVPACLLLGSYVGVKLFKKDPEVVKLLAMVGFVALFAAFFKSVIAGLLGLLLVSKQVKIKLNVILIVIAASASVICVAILHLIDASPYFTFPPYYWHINLADVIAVPILLIAGFGTTLVMGFMHGQIKRLHAPLTKKAWWLKGLLASVGLSLLFLLGGPLVEFTGNFSIQPMLAKAPSLGIIGLLWLAVIKLGAISWSKAMGYRGGLVFPSIFVASTLVAIAQIFSTNVNFVYGVIAAVIGIIAANRKVKILF